MGIFKKLAVGAAALSLAAAMPLSASACLEPSPFEDVPYNDLHFSPIGYCYYQDLMKGVSPERFDPQGTVSRAMAVTALYRADVLHPAGEDSGFFYPGESSFVDVASGSWYADAVAWAHAGGLLSGVGGNRFAPHDPVTRQDLAVILYRRAGEPYRDWDFPPTATEEMADSPQISPYAKLAVEWAYAQNLLSAQEEDGVLFLSPRAPVTRAGLAEALMKATYDGDSPLGFNLDIVESIEITNLYRDETVTVTDPAELAKLVERFNGYRAKGVSFPKKEELGVYRSYRVRVREQISWPGTTTFYMDPSGADVTLSVYGLEALYRDPDQLPPPGDSKNIFEDYFKDLPEPPLFDLDPEAVNSVSIRSGATGQEVEITDREEIRALADLLNAFEVESSYTLEPGDGWSYSMAIDLNITDGGRTTLSFATNSAGSVDFSTGSTAEVVRYLAKNPDALPREFFEGYFR